MSTHRPCPLCGSATNPKFDRTSDWCAPCTHTELLDQELEDSSVVIPEITPPLPKSDGARFARLR